MGKSDHLDGKKFSHHRAHYLTQSTGNKSNNTANHHPTPRSQFGTHIAMPWMEPQDSQMADGATIPGLKRHMKPCAPIPGQLQLGIARIAETDCPVLIAGEHGVGKRSIAGAVAHVSGKASRSRRFTG